MKMSWVGGLAVAVSMTMAAQQPMPHAHIYPEVDAAKTEIAAALAKAKVEHKRVLLDFGGDWCGDCQMLNYAMHLPQNEELMKKYYILVDVNVGHVDQNLELGEKYGVVLKKGVPAISVLRADGSVVYAQKGGEFEDFRHMQPSDLTTFLEAWKPR